jgi:predicted PurR-regulated permease PerM
MIEPRTDLARNTLGVLFIAGLILAAFWILRPFIGAAVWATTITVATWPVLRRLQQRLGGRRLPAVLLMTLALLLLFMVPFTLGIVTLIDYSDEIVGAAKRLATLRMPVAPEWLSSLPYVGPKIDGFWRETVASGPDGVMAKLMPYVGRATRWLVGEVGTVGSLLVQVLLIVLLSTLMYAKGEIAAMALLRVGRRLGGLHGEAVVVLAGQAIRGVALGVGVTAVVQSVLGGIGLAIAGVPYAGLLTVLMFICCLAQIGPVLVMLPAVVWLYWSGDNGWGTFLLVVTGLVGTLDNFLRPILIRRGADLPLLLIFGGVIGGLLAFGLVGIFVGPVVLAVAYTLMQAWVGDGESRSPTAGDDGP